MIAKSSNPQGELSKLGGRHSARMQSANTTRDIMPYGLFIQVFEVARKCGIHHVSLIRKGGDLVAHWIGLPFAQIAPLTSGSALGELGPAGRMLTHARELLVNPNRYQGSQDAQSEEPLGY
jgi:hypothetical protein